MKSNHVFLKTILISIVVLCAGPFALQAQVRQDDRRVCPFVNIVLEVSANTHVYINYDKTPALKVKTDQRFMDNIKTSVSGETLKIFVDTNHPEDVKVEVYISIPVVKKVIIRGGGQVEVKDGFDPGLLQADILGGWEHSL